MNEIEVLYFGLDYSSSNQNDEIFEEVEFQISRGSLSFTNDSLSICASASFLILSSFDLIDRSNTQ